MRITTSKTLTSLLTAFVFVLAFALTGCTADSLTGPLDGDTIELVGNDGHNNANGNDGHNNANGNDGHNNANGNDGHNNANGNDGHNNANGNDGHNN